MFKKTDFLGFAFDEAVNSMGANSFEDKLAEDVIATKMNAYAKREGQQFTKEEINETIARGLGTLKSATEDFQMQKRMMN